MLGVVEIAVKAGEVVDDVIEDSAVLDILQIMSRMSGPSRPASSRVLTFMFRQVSIRLSDGLPSDSASNPVSVFCISEFACSRFEKICMPMALSHLRRVR